MAQQAAEPSSPSGVSGCMGDGLAPQAGGDLYRLFADLLEYPTPALARQAEECWLRLAVANAPAADLLHEFRRFVEQTPPARLEEIFAATFDLQAVCYPYVGYHLFGESYKRGQFMARLNEGYRQRGFSAGSELPDHVAIVLRFLALGSVDRVPERSEGDDFAQALLSEGLIPALDKMALAFGEPAGNPYAAVIRALLLVLRNEEGDRQ